MTYALQKNEKLKQGHEEEQILVTLFFSHACHRYVKTLGITYKFS